MSLPLVSNQPISRERSVLKHPAGLTFGQIYPIHVTMKREAFLRALEAYAKSEDLAFSWDPVRGKGGHGTVTVGSAFTTVPSGEIKAGLKFAILKQLGLPRDALR